MTNATTFATGTADAGWAASTERFAHQALATSAMAFGAAALTATAAFANADAPSRAYTTAPAPHTVYDYALTSIEPYFTKSWTMADHVSNDLKVKQFKQLVPHMDEAALAGICALTVEAFKDKAPSTGFRISWLEDSDELPMLFFQVDTHGMELDSLLDRELDLRAQIAANSKLKQASQYVGLSIT